MFVSAVFHMTACRESVLALTSAQHSNTANGSDPELFANSRSNQKQTERTRTAGAELGLRLAVRDGEVNEAAGQHAESIQSGGENPPDESLMWLLAARCLWAQQSAQETEM